jgi:hypothetical protein
MAVFDLPGEKGIFTLCPALFAASSTAAQPPRTTSDWKTPDRVVTTSERTYGSPLFWHIYSRFFSAASLLECTMSKLMGRTAGTGIQCRAMDMNSQVRRTKAS